MDDLLEIVLDLLLEGVFWAGEERKVSPRIRIPLLVVSAVLTAALIAFFLCVGFLMLKDEPLVGLLMLLCGACLAIWLWQRVRRHLEKK